MTQLDKFKTWVGEPLSDASKDMQLELMLETAKESILDYTNRAELLPKMEGLQRELAVLYYVRHGSEGESSRSEGGISVTYSTEMPDNIKSRLNAFRLLKGVRIANEGEE